ncbi:MAG TPA: hypothetical protein DCX79_20050, partial [Planctomycetaceae bacterium]|nr:hypothetical protein [Planctomycetaceae bacterium]
MAAAGSGISMDPLQSGQRTFLPASSSLTFPSHAQMQRILMDIVTQISSREIGPGRSMARSGMKVPGGNGIQAIANDYGAAGAALAGAGVAAAPSAGGAVGASPG